MTSTRALPRVLTLGAAVVFIATACSQAPGGSTAPSSAAGGGSYEQFTPDATLLAAAKTEGTLTTIALPPDWCNYGQAKAESEPQQRDRTSSKARTASRSTS